MRWLTGFLVGFPWWLWLIAAFAAWAIVVAVLLIALRSVAKKIVRFAKEESWTIRYMR
jgi:hypothetical protein